LPTPSKELLEQLATIRAKIHRSVMPFGQVAGLELDYGMAAKNALIDC
jgi:hypothetical protein